MPRRKSRRKRRKRRRYKHRNTRRSRKRGGLAVPLERITKQRKAIDRAKTIESYRKKDKNAILWEKGDGKCYICRRKFGASMKGMLWKHHCRTCGKAVCDKDSKKQQRIYKWGIYGMPIHRFRECDRCWEKEEDSIKKVMGENNSKGQRPLAIAALRRAMFEKCKNQESRDKMIGCLRFRGKTYENFWNEVLNNPFERDEHIAFARLPTKEEVEKAKDFLHDEETRRYLDDDWSVRNQINKKFPPPKEEEEQETDMLGFTTVARKLGLDQESRLHSRKQGRAELKGRATTAIVRKQGGRKTRRRRRRRRG